MPVMVDSALMHGLILDTIASNVAKSIDVWFILLTYSQNYIFLLLWPFR